MIFLLLAVMLYQILDAVRTKEYQIAGVLAVVFCVVGFLAVYPGPSYGGAH